VDREFKKAQGRFARALALALCGILFAAAAALAQGSALDQYVPKVNDRKQGGPDTLPGGGSPVVPDATPDGDSSPTEVAVAIERGEAGGGTIPGSGFSITPFIAIVLALVLALIAARVAWSLRERNGSIRTR